MALENALQNPTNPICSHLLKLGFDVFSKKIAAEDAFGGENIDESKLQNIASCENKRLMRFAAEFPFEQHLLNLQSILVSLLDKLSRHLTDQTTSIAEFHRELSRIAVLLQELDIELAKAKRRKDFANYAEHRATLFEEELIKLAAELNKGKGSYQSDYRLEMQARYQAMQKEADKLKAKEAAEKRELERHAANVKAAAIQARNVLNQFHLHVNRLVLKRALEKAKERRVHEKLKLIIDNMSVANELKEEILKEALTGLRLSPK